MKIAYIGFGHIDVTLPLLRKLRGLYRHEIDYYILLPAGNPIESVIDLRGKNSGAGIFSWEESRRMLPGWFNNYFHDQVRTRIILYPFNQLWSSRTHWLFHRLAILLQAGGYDLIHFSGISFFLLDLLLSRKLRRIPRIVTIHDLVPHSGEDSWIRKLLDLQSKVMKRYPVILHNTDDYMKVRDRGDVYYIPFGILDFYPEIEAVEAESSDILLFGRISPYKGIPELLTAFRSLLPAYPGLKLCIAGKGNLEADISGLAQNLKLINRYIPTAELAGLIRKTKIIACPYRDATQSAVLATAHAFSKAAVVSNVAGFKDVVRDRYNGVLVPPRDPESLARAIELLLDDRFRGQMERNIGRFYQESPFHWDQIARSQHEVYKKIAAGYSW